MFKFFVQYFSTASHEIVGAKETTISPNIDHAGAYLTARDRGKVVEYATKNAMPREIILFSSEAMNTKRVAAAELR